MAIWERIDGTANMNINFSRAQFLETTEPYEYLCGMKNDPLRHAREMKVLKSNAREEGVDDFEKRYEFYCDVQKRYKLDSKGGVPRWAWRITWGIMLAAILLNLFGMLLRLQII